jgi:hypothetical protein
MSQLNQDLSFNCEHCPIMAGTSMPLSVSRMKACSRTAVLFRVAATAIDECIFYFVKSHIYIKVYK